MNISKHLHSCLLVEEQETTVLTDPGIFTYQEKALDISNLNKLDYILITHEHPDHFHLPFIKDLVSKFPSVTIISNESVVDLLRKEHISATIEGTELISPTSIPHEDLWDKTPPPHVLFTLFDKLTHPGDSHHFTSTTEIIALPVQAPWGSTIDAVHLALRLKPKVIIPIHDWMWKDGFRKSMYQRLQEFFGKEGIEFKPLETGEVVEV